MFDKRVHTRYSGVNTEGQSKMWNLPYSPLLARGHPGLQWVCPQGPSYVGAGATSEAGREPDPAHTVQLVARGTVHPAVGSHRGVLAVGTTAMGSHSRDPPWGPPPWGPTVGAEGHSNELIVLLSLQ